jgi:DNA recombination protein RmuC
MERELVYIVLSFVVGIGLTALVYQLLVVKNYKVNERNLRSENEKKEMDLALERKLGQELSADYIGTKRDLEHSQIRLAEQKGELEKLNEQLTKEFENIANKVVYHNSKVMQEQHEEKLLAMLTPFKDKIESFEKKVDDTHKESIKDSQSLKEQLLQLKELNKSIGDEAKNLTSALKGDKKMQGDWGEHKLERILQAAGLDKETHYKKQVNLKDEFNNNLRPGYR